MDGWLTGYFTDTKGSKEAIVTPHAVPLYSLSNETVSPNWLLGI